MRGRRSPACGFTPCVRKAAAPIWQARCRGAVPPLQPFAFDRDATEGLTNARKHAPASAVEVTVGGEEELVVVVLTRGSARRVDGSGGSGLIGLAERVELAGGVLQHGPNARGDFVLRAVLPR